MQANTTNSLAPWKKYISITLQSLASFYIATFCVAMFFLHKGQNWLSSGLLLGMLYAFVIFACTKRVMQSVSLPALMIIIPLAPLMAIIVIISLIPILQIF